MKSSKFKMALLILVFLFLASGNNAIAQNAHVELIKNKQITSSIKNGEKHEYTIKLEVQQFSFIRLNQKGIDILITTYDPDGKKLQDFDSPNGANGPELITIISEKKGNYRIEVKPFDEKEAKGSYDLKIEMLEPKAVTPEKQTDQLFAAWNNMETPGASVAVAKDGKIVFKKGYGSANLEYDIPNSPATIFHIASVSKQFTAFSILLLANDGKLSLNDDIRKYIPEMPDFGKTITLKQLIHHTSGLRDQWNILAIAGWRLDDVITTEQVLKMMSKQKELNFNPGDEHMYCNTGYTLLAEVVARVSGQSFAEFTKKRIFEPLKMNNTQFYDDYEKIVKNRSYSFYQNEFGYKKSVLSYSTAGATSLFTTAEDLCLWAINFENPKVGNKQIIEQMNERGILNSGDTISYAFGQDIGNYKGLKYLSHGGADAGYRSFLGRFPDQKFSVVVLSNFANFQPWDYTLKIADIYLKDKFVKEEHQKEIKDTTTTDKTIVVDNEILNTYCGKYQIQENVIFNVVLENNQLFAKINDNEKFQLNPVSNTEFNVKGLGIKVTFSKEDDGEISKCTIDQGGQLTNAPRLKPFDATSVNLSEFAGEYYSPEISTTYTFEVDKEKLVAKHMRLSDIVMSPVRTDFFSGSQWFFGQIEFIRDSNKKITGCKVSSGRIRNLKFEKIDGKK